VRMGRKGKTQKHTAKEIAAKHKAAKERQGAAGGGGAGAKARLQATLKAQIYCKICKASQPSVKSMGIHYDSKHPKENWAECKVIYEAEMPEKVSKKKKKKETTSTSTAKKSSKKKDDLSSLTAGLKSMKVKKKFGATTKKKKKK